MGDVNVRVEALDDLPEGAAVALVGPPHDLVWVIRADATGAEIASALQPMMERIGQRYPRHMRRAS